MEAADKVIPQAFSRGSPVVLTELIKNAHPFVAANYGLESRRSGDRDWRLGIRDPEQF